MEKCFLFGSDANGTRDAVPLLKTKKGWTQLADVAARRRPKLVEAERRAVVWRLSASCP